MVQLGHAGEKKGEEEPSEDFTRRDQHHFGLRDLEVMETLGGSRLNCFVQHFHYYWIYIYVSAMYRSTNRSELPHARRHKE